MSKSNSEREKEKRFFAVASVGKKRWYWVVWPSLKAMQTQETTIHIADGYESEKADAVDCALNLAGFDGEWVAGKYAKDYHRQKNGRNQAQAPVVVEFLYQDRQDLDTDDWYSVPFRVIKKTPKFVFVAQNPYDANEVTGSWLDRDIDTYRLNRQVLESEGYTLAPNIDIDDPLFFATPYQNRLTAAPACFAKLQLDFPASTKAVRSAYRQLVRQVHPDHGGDHNDFLALQAAYEQALRLATD